MGSMPGPPGTGKSRLCYGAAVRIVCIGGGPAGLYAAILMKKADPTRQVAVYERLRAGESFGFGVVFSDATLGNLGAADAESYAQIRAAFSHWDDIDVHYGGELLRSTGHGFSGLSRRRLLEILVERAHALGVETHFEHPVDDVSAFIADADLVVAADGIASGIRERFAEFFKPNVDMRPNRFIWLGTTRRFPAFTFYFRENEHGLFRVHAYNYDADQSTFIVECTEACWRAAGLDTASEDESAAYCAALFAEELEGHALLTNKSIWRQFATVSNGRWSHENVVLLGDAAHTAHFSIGSGTKLAMEDAIALANAVDAHDALGDALAAYEKERRPVVDSTQRAAAVSLQWFEDTERYFGRLEPHQFAYSLLTRSMRINHTNLRLRDPEFTGRIDRWFAGGRNVPPMFTSFSLREITVPNRVMVSPMCMYSAVDGTIDDWHLVHLGSRAVGGAGLVMAEMTDVSADGRITPGCAGLYKDEHAHAWKRVVDFVHQRSEAKIGIQLGHAGRKGSTRLLWEGMDQPLDDALAWETLGPSALPYFPHSPPPRPMTRADMVQVIADYVAATERAEAAGFDIVELHAAHGYLLASFLSPLTNHRTDEYGGDLTNRMRLLLEVFDAIRAAWPQHKPIAVRISATDWAEGGFDVADAVAVSRALKARGCDIVDVSTGQTGPFSNPEYGRLYQTPFSETVRLEADIPTITVGSISSYGDLNSIIASGRADLCALARAHLYDPYWTRHAAYEQGVRCGWPKQYLAISRYTPRMEWSLRGNSKD